jgi:hypothetical protein
VARTRRTPASARYMRTVLTIPSERIGITEAAPARDPWFYAPTPSG